MEKWTVDLTEYDSEIWYEEDAFNTREEAIKEGKKLAIKNGNENHFRIGIKEPIGIPCIDADSILEDLSEQVYDEVGEIAEDYLCYIDKDHVKELEGKLNEVLHKWMKKYKHEPDFYTIKKEEFINLYK